MITMRTNAAEFAAEVARELKAAGEDAVVEMTRRVALHLRGRAAETSPSDPGRRPGAIPLQESWSVSVGEPNLKKGLRGSHNDAVAALQNLQIGETVFVQSSDFTSTFFEHGTEKMPPRPIVQPAIEETREWVG